MRLMFIVVHFYDVFQLERLDSLQYIVLCSKEFSQINECLRVKFRFCECIKLRDVAWSQELRERRRKRELDAITARRKTLRIRLDCYENCQIVKVSSRKRRFMTNEKFVCRRVEKKIYFSSFESFHSSNANRVESPSRFRKIWVSPHWGVRKKETLEEPWTRRKFSFNIMLSNSIPERTSFSSFCRLSNVVHPSHVSTSISYSSKRKKFQDIFKRHRPLFTSHNKTREQT